MEVRVGLEFDWFEDHGQVIAPFVESIPLDYRIGASSRGPTLLDREDPGGTRRCLDQILASAPVDAELVTSLEQERLFGPYLLKPVQPGCQLDENLLGQVARVCLPSGEAQQKCVECPGVLVIL